ncbi:MAG: ABC transporter permease [Flavihumibacter sp.]
MFKKYMITAWRNLVRNRSFSIINISGLAIGMAAAMLIMLWIQNELTFDRIYTHTDRLYQAFSREAGKGKASAWSGTPDPLASALKAHYADIEEAVRVFESESLVTVNEKHIKSTGVFADPGFISMFDFPVVKGSSVLQEMNHIVLTEGLALKLFGTTDVVGKSVRVDTDTAGQFIVSAVLRKLPSNTRFRFEYVLPSAYADKLYGRSESWTAFNVRTYVLLKKGANADAVNEKIKYVAFNHLDKEDQEAGLTNFLYPAKRWHLYDKSENGQMVGGQIERVKLFGWIAALIIVIACINFTNLSTARSEKRAREVGVRKVIGANRNSLIVQFIAESVVLAFIAGLIAIALAHFSLPWYNRLLHTDFSLSYHLPAFWLTWIAFVLITGLLAGSYPAFFLSSFNAAVVLKGGFRFSGKRITPRKALVVLQFTFAVTLIISTLIIRKQIRYAEERDTGFDKGQLVFSPITDETGKHYSALKHDLLNSGAVTAVTRSLVPISADWTSNMWVSMAGQRAGRQPQGIRCIQHRCRFCQNTGNKACCGKGYRYL